MQDESLTVAFATGLAIIGLVSVPAISTFILQLTTRKPKQDGYEDGDGRATPESVKAYSAKWPKTLIVLFAFVASGSSIASAIWTTIHARKGSSLLENWLSAGALILVLFQAIAIASCRESPVKSYNLGLYSFLCTLILAVILFAQGTDEFELLLRDEPVQFALRIVEIASVIALGVSSLCIPRRPEVYDSNGKPIDAMYTASALSRFTWGWPLHLLKAAGERGQLDMGDLPRLNQYNRSAELSANWKQRAPDRPLWLAVIWYHKWGLVKQWLLTLVTAFLNFGPQWVILQLLRILETSTQRDSYALDVWIWVIWLGIVIIAQNWVEAHVFWVSVIDLSVPIRSQLSALIFEKSMRKKDVKGTGRNSNSKKAAQDGECAEPVIAAAAGESTATDSPEVPEEEEDESEALKKSKQGTVNLIGVDTKRVSDLAMFQNMFPGSLAKLIVSLSFLVSLLGWQALLAGFSTMLAIMPINIWASKRYAKAQDKLMKVRDDKLAVVNEALQGIRQIKFSASEPQWQQKIDDVREEELKSVWTVFMSDTVLLACWVTTPIALAAVSLTVYAALYGTLLPSVAFVSLGVFRALEVTLSVIPELTTDALDAWTSIKRIEKYLQSPEIENLAAESDEVTFDHASIAWPADEELDDEERFVLRDVTVTFPKGELSVISGKTGAGKSLMLAAILGEVDILSGKIAMPRPPAFGDRNDSKATRDNWIIPECVAYVAQIPWIENASIRDNIEFGLPHDEERYQKTIEVCALRKDLEMLSDGEKTEIGANGINLSGGQKWRVTLARAIYSRAGILVFDDIFSAVDAHVGRHIFEKCLTGDLAVGRTRILVTHHVALCQPKTKYLVELGDGKVLHAGLLSELQNDGTLELIKSHEQTSMEIREDENLTAVNSQEASDEEADEAGASGDTLKKVLSKQQEARKFVEDEKREQGAIKTHVYSVYLRDSGGFVFWAGLIAVYVVVQAILVGRSWWLRIWTGDDAAREQSLNYAVSLQSVDLYPHAQALLAGTASDAGQHSLGFYMRIYVALALAAALIGTLKYWYTYLGSIRASRRLFAKLNFVILRAPLRWLDTVPVGRILNRFTADFHIIDSQLANSFAFGAGSVLQLIGIIVASLFVSPYLVLLAVVLLVFALRFAILYLHGARPVKRLESTAKSPVFEQFGSALTGVATIRGFDKTNTYVDRMFARIDDYGTATWHLWLFNRWMGWRMALVGSMFAIAVSVLVLLTPGINAALAGFALAFALEFAHAVTFTVRLYANLELNMNAAERIVEFTELEHETLEGATPPAAWPTEGIIEVDDLVVGYAPDLPPVLKGLTFSVNRNERIGVVGRTGAGKSSLTLALFRFLEARSGTIHIDGLDISKIKLHDLRSRLAIIPQDPVLFTGTVRSNLDPFDRHTDAELRDSLERVHLIRGTGGTATPLAPAPANPETDADADAQPGNANIFNDLSSPISEGGLNLSQGQRQLLCLARAIVARPRVMVLDEATSAVDMSTDALIQRSIREEFTDATLLVIAHRLSTIADFDRILVLSDGRVAEFGRPRELWEKDGGSANTQAIMTTPIVRPPSLPPNIASTSTLALIRTPTVILRHPGYGIDNILLTLPAVDATTTTTSPGLHQRTVLTAGAIIADNAFDRVYLTRDRAGIDRVDATLPLDGLLEPGEYWLQLNGYELFRDVQEDTRAVISSIPPPAPPRPTPTSAARARNPLPTSIPSARARAQSSTPPSPDSTPQTPSRRNAPYPIVPSFGDWQFPHNRLPAEWKQCHLAPQPPLPPSSSHMSSTPSRRCWITGYHMGINECHLVPRNQDVWWAANSMRQYTMNTDGVSRDAANIALLRADIHQVLDGHKFAIVPKPSLSPSSGSSGSSSFAFAAHVLQSDYEAREFCSLYHNVAVAQAGVDRLSPEFLFARFAWAIFAHLQTFLNSSITRRCLAVMVRSDTDRYTELKQMDGQEWTKYLAVRGVTRSGSRTRKRSSSQITQERNDGRDTGDAYQERWERRSRSLESADPSSGGDLDDDLDPEMRQVRMNTRWYDEVGQFSRGDLEQEQLDRNTRWYDKAGRAGLSDEEEQSETDEADCDSDLECEHGPPRGRRHHLGSSPLGSDAMPQLSCSFTTHGSNRSSSSLADLPGREDENEPDRGVPVGSAVPSDKVLGVVDGPISDHNPPVDGHHVLSS